ncbi:MAG: type pantothenate kinase [Chloroflexota bacterium]|jgi:type III pantothenate kinase|nr:type pantothenate kinase [Chloroflexota bacterium]
MLLAVDIGNSAVKLCVFRQSKVVARMRVPTDLACTADELGSQLNKLLAQSEIRPGAIDRVVLCSVVPALTAPFVKAIHQYVGYVPLVVGPQLATGLHFGSYDPTTLGADRIANVVAARELYGAPAVVVDCGTATNLEVLGRDGTFMGGVIAPGMVTAFDGLVAKAAQLRRIGLEPPPHAIGTSTVECLQSGTLLGHVALVEGLLARIRAEMQDTPRIVGTGGLIDVVAAQTTHIDVVDHDLTVQGLRLLAELNPA